MSTSDASARGEWSNRGAEAKEKTEESCEWYFTSEQADACMGEITVTYLDYGALEQSLSTNVISKVYPMHRAKGLGIC